ncbi:MAG: Holliday junction branch migration protein RuvA [Rhodospirillales bacterium]|jgi:Holliday junction DNA helicase RuvA
MIAKLTGTLDTSALDHAVIDVGGVGYLVQASGRTLRRLGNPGGAVSVLTEMHVREDRMVLYGFADAAERDYFRLLTTVQGVGPRVALNILTALEPGALTQAILAGDKVALSQADGVGAKLAARVAAELKDKVGDLSLGPAATVTAAAAPTGTAATEAVSALVNLGYKRVEAFAAVTKAKATAADAAVGDLIRLALKELSS